MKRLSLLLTIVGFIFSACDKDNLFEGYIYDSSKIPHNTIYYTSVDQTIVNPLPKSCGANIISNTYKDGFGIIEFDDDITSIGEKAFYYRDGLTSITIPNSVTSIGSTAFACCTSLTSITIPNSVTKIGDSAFAYCDGLTSITIPNSVTSIGLGAFYKCHGLTSVTIPNSVTSIGDWAFYECGGLTSITIPNSVTSIGVNPFRYCSKLKAFKGKFASSDGRCLIVDGVLNSFAPSGLTTYTILNSVTSIGEDAFIGCDGLTTITIPESITSIEEAAFVYCDGLTSITIPNSVTSIGNLAFYGCTNLVSVYCKPTTPPASGSDMFTDNAYSRIIYVPLESLEKYKTLSYWSDYKDDIFAYDFENNEILGSWTLTYTATNKVTPYSESAFGANILFNKWDHSTGQGILGFDREVQRIGKNAFLNCSDLTSIAIPDNVTNIGDTAFMGCSYLKSVTIGKSISKIGASAFKNCNSLSKIYCKPTTPPAIYIYVSNGFVELSSFPTSRPFTVYVPRNSYNAYTQYYDYIQNEIARTNWFWYTYCITPYDF